MNFKANSQQQAEIQHRLSQANAAERDDMERLAHGNLEILGGMFKNVGKLAPDLEQEAALSIETICRCESIREGRGSFFRLRRRLALTKQYFQPW